jgi:hypothetical protein
VALQKLQFNKQQKSVVERWKNTVEYQRFLKSEIKQKQTLKTVIFWLRSLERFMKNNDDTQWRFRTGF